VKFVQTVVTYFNVLNQNYNRGKRKIVFIDNVFAGNIILFFCRGHPVVFIKLKDIKNILVSVKHNNILYFIVILTKCFGQLTIMRPSLRHLE